MNDTRPLIDAHDLGHGQTGNETYLRCLVDALEAVEPGTMRYATTAAGAKCLPGSVAPADVTTVSSSSVRRLGLDLPAACRAMRPSALLVQYTMPIVRTPIVAIIHDLSFEAPEAADWLPWRSRMRYRATIRATAKFARRIVVPSEWTRQDLLTRYQVDPTKVVVAKAALDPVLQQGFAALEPRPGSEADAEVRVLSVGTILPRKNLIAVARAVALLRTRGVAVRYAVVGPIRDKAQADDLRATLPTGLDLVGEVSQAELIAHYGAADVLCFPSRFEGFGIPLLEAMAAGVPVVSSTATCLPEIAGDAAVFVDPDDVAGWAEAIMTAGTGDTRSQLIRTGRAQVATFSWSDTATTIRAALASV